MAFEEDLDEEADFLGDGAESAAARPARSSASFGNLWEHRRRLLAGISLLWAASVVAGFLVALGRSAGTQRIAGGQQAGALAGAVQEKFGLDAKLKDHIVADARTAFKDEVERQKDDEVQQVIEGIEGHVVAAIERQIDEQLAQAPLELEPDKVGIMPRSFSRTCVRDSLAEGEHILLFYHDDDDADDIPNTAEEIAAGFQGENAAFIGNDHLKKLEVTGVKMCLEESHAANGECNSLCYTVVDGDWTYEGPGIPSGMQSDWQKLVVALSGQIDTGIKDQGTFGNFVETMLHGRHCTSKTESESPMYCWMCPSLFDGPAAGKVGQWGQDTGNWHVWGYGMTLDRASSGDELLWQKKECNDSPGPWDTFYIVARVLQAPTSTPPPLASPTTLAPTTLAPTTKVPASPTSLFCFCVMNTQNYELSLVRSQLSRGASIFACDAWSVFSDTKTWLSPGPPVRIENTVLDIQVQAAAGTSTHFLNTDVFTTAWKMIHKEGKYKEHAWTVKVDPDCVFIASRLRDHVGKLPYFPNGVYMLNCLFNDGKFWFFGALEVISRKAVETYFEGSDACMSQLDRGELGEDTWLRKCLDILHVSSTKDTNLLADGYCNEAPSPCVSGKVAFHPFKSADAYFQCWKEASAQ